MGRRAVLLVTGLLISLFWLLPIRLNQIEVKAPNGYPVHNLNTGLNYTSIQEAIDANETQGGHTIFVEEGIYYDHVIVNKSLTLRGESKENTVIDGGSKENVMNITANYVRITGFKIQNSGNSLFGNPPNAGIYMPSNGSIIVGNTIEHNQFGILFSDSSNNSIVENIITYNKFGVGFLQSSNVTVSKNNIRDNDYHGISFEDSSKVSISGNSILSHSYHGIMFLYCADITISENNIERNDEGIGFRDCSGILILGNNITNNEHGIISTSSSSNVISRNNINSKYSAIELYDSSYTSICRNNLSNNHLGLVFEYFSDNNTVSGNDISNNNFGMVFDNFPCSGNSIYNNNFRFNINQAFMETAGHIGSWNNSYPSGGNYWSDYNGTDANLDGIGETPYTIDSNNTDHYPLMGMFYSYNVSWVDSAYIVDLISNSAISAFDVGVWIEHPEERIIRFNVTGENGTTGFCRICIPTALMNGTYKVFVNGTEVFSNLLSCSDSTHSYLYFNYTHSTQEVVIIAEFPSFLILPLFMTATLMAVIIYKRKRTV